MTTPRLLLLLLVIVAGIGCGGGGESGPPSGLALSVPVSWPQRTRDVQAPASALSLTLTVDGAGQHGQDATFTFNRNDNLAAHTETYTTGPSLVGGTRTFSIDFHAQANGQGPVVATAGGSVSLQSSSQLPNVTVDSTVKSVAVVGPQEVEVGANAAIVVEAKDAGGNLVAVTPGSFRFAITEGGANATLHEDALMGVSPGPAVVRASLDNLNGTATVRVFDWVTLRANPRTVWVAFQSGNSTWQRLIGTDLTYRGKVLDESERYGFAQVSSFSATAYRMDLVYGTLGEAREVHTAFDEFKPVRNLSATVSGIASNEQFASWGINSAGTSAGGGLKRLQVIAGPADFTMGKRDVNNVLVRVGVVRDVPDPQVDALTFDFATQGVPLVETTLPGPVLNLKYSTRSGSYIPGIKVSPSVWRLPDTSLYQEGDQLYYVNDNPAFQPNNFLRAMGTWDPRSPQTPWAAPATPYSVQNVNFIDAGGMRTYSATLPYGEGDLIYWFENRHTRGYISQGWHGVGPLNYTLPDLSQVEGWSSEYNLAGRGDFVAGVYTIDKPFGEAPAFLMANLPGAGNRPLYNATAVWTVVPEGSN